MINIAYLCQLEFIVWSSKCSLVFNGIEKYMNVAIVRFHLSSTYSR